MKHELLIDNKKIIVFAQIKGFDDNMELKFILDTGSSITVIDDGAVIRLGYDLKQLKKGDRLMTAGGGVYSKTLELPMFSLFGKDLNDFEVSVMNMPPQISYFADGLIGMDFLLRFKKFAFDFDENVIEIFETA